MKYIFAILTFVFLANELKSQENKLLIPDTIEFHVGHSSWWKNGEYTFFSKGIIVIENNEGLPKKGTELSENEFEYLLGLFETDMAWEANLILYATFNRDAKPIFQPDLTEDIWLDVFIEKELKYWQELYDKKKWGDFVLD